MKNLNFEKLMELKVAVDNGKAQKVEMQNVCSFIDEEYYKRSKLYTEIKDYIEARVSGISISVTGGRKLKGMTDISDCSYDPIVITTNRNNDKTMYNVIKIDGFLIDEPNAASMIYQNYLDFFIEGSKFIEHYVVSLWENVLKDTLDITYLCECGFYADSNKLIQIKEDKSYTVVADIDKDVEGVITTFIEGNDEPVVIVVCRESIIMLMEDSFYIDSEVA